ncbi:hypothetical protein JCM10908_004457 [Rhodotorula pacifica]|uniref:phosphatidylinositol N-acetylglucosaminyltransferase n=1 Tax=Rhodotorula pacifica TaxID=1495444 RepID=UPI00316C1693
MNDSESASLPYTAVFYPPLVPSMTLSASPIFDHDSEKLDRSARLRQQNTNAIATPSSEVSQIIALLNAQDHGSPVIARTSSSRNHNLRLCACRLFRAATALLSFQVPGIGSLSELTCVANQDVRRNSRLNLLWLCINDIIVGVALGTFIRDNRGLFLSVTETFVRTYVLGYLRDLLLWLSSWPMGIKLNDEIAAVICRAFLGLSNLWEHVCLEPMLAHLPVGLIGLTGILGASTLFALIADLLSVLTLPFFACYVVATFTFRQSFSMLHALFDVFRGRKFNPLRNRTEPATYEVDELLLGTILFVMLSAIFPTIAAFYLAFASSRLLILALQNLLMTAVGALNAFPLFMLLLRFKSPARLPGGAELVECEDRFHWPEPHLHLRVRTMSYSAIFAGLVRVSSELFSPDAMLHAVTCLWTGRVIWSRVPTRTMN